MNKQKYFSLSGGVPPEAGGADISVTARPYPRGGVDRRQKRRCPLFHPHSLFGRRRHIRREIDKTRHTHLDWYRPHFLFVVLAILLLCFADAHNTLQLLGHGAVERNILMDILIQNGTGLFVMVKLLGTALCLMVLLTVQHVRLFNLIRVSYVMYGLLGVYVSLISYQLAIWPGDDPFLFFVPL